MRLLLLILVLLTTLAALYYQRVGELPLGFQLPESEVCEVIRARRDSAFADEAEADPSYNDYADGVRFILRGCFVR